MWTYIIIAIVLLGIYGIFISSREDKKADEKHDAELRNRGIDPSAKVQLESYIGGHPDIDNAVDNVLVYPEGEVLVLYKKNYVQEDKKKIDKTVSLQKLATIPVNAIKEINVEDSSSIQKSATLGRWLLAGPAALAWKKTEKIEKAYVNIIWSDGSFSHNTLFEYKNMGAMGKANASRNQLIRLVKAQNA